MSSILGIFKNIILISEPIECRNLDFELPIIEVIGEENNFETDKIPSKTFMIKMAYSRE